MQSSQPKKLTTEETRDSELDETEMKQEFETFMAELKRLSSDNNKYTQDY